MRSPTSCAEDVRNIIAREGGHTKALLYWEEAIEDGW